MSQSRSPPNVEERLARLEARLARRQAAVQAAHENIASARIELNDIHSDPAVRDAVVEHALAGRSLDRAQRKLDNKTRELEAAKERFRRRIQRDLTAKEQALEAANDEVDAARTALEEFRRDMAAQASNNVDVHEDERFAHNLALAVADSDELSQEELHVINEDLRREAALRAAEARRAAALREAEARAAALRGLVR